jgi:hypothetical protein
MPFDGGRFDTVSTFVTADAGPKRADQESKTRTALGRVRRILARFIHVPGETARTVTPLEVANLLWDARHLIEEEKHWLRGAYHRTPGHFCAVGALRRAGRAASPAAVIAAHNLLLGVARSGGFPTIEQMNDRTCHEFVLSAFDSAIASALE